MTADDVVLIDDSVWVVSRKTNQPLYDFPVWEFIPSRRPYMRPGVVNAIARIGAIDHYDKCYSELLVDGIQLVHDPGQHTRCSELSGWYPSLKEFTPRSLVFAHPPEAKEIEAEFGWPIFMKGMRQTSRHQRSLSIIETANHYEQAVALYKDDPILHWQSLVVREFVPLRSVGAGLDQNSIPPSFEFRYFFWKNQLAACGSYWTDAKYEATAVELQEATQLAQKVAYLIDVAFLVVDVAQREDGRWIVIECNDGQESGYAGVSRLALWQKIVDLEKSSH